MGSAACEALAAKGIPVLMACRNLSKAGAVRDGILSRNPSANLEIRHLDLCSLASVREFAESVGPGSVDSLFHNAGVISRRYELTADGLEKTFSTNYFGPWLLTRLLLPRMPHDARIVSMVSLSCRYVKLCGRDLQMDAADFTQLGSYASAKRALLSFSLELSRRHPELRVNLADPGIVGTDMIDLGHWFDPLTDIIFKPFCYKPAKGVQPALRALEASLPGPRYYVGKGSKDIPRCYRTPELDGELWTMTEDIIEGK